jgi:hypothetical protein
MIQIVISLIQITTFLIGITLQEHIDHYETTQQPTGKRIPYGSQMIDFIGIAKEVENILPLKMH